MVCHDAKDPDAVIAIAAQGIEQKFQAGAACFIRQEFQNRPAARDRRRPDANIPSPRDAGHGRARQPGLAGPD
jgi:hypothetical protein